MFRDLLANFPYTGIENETITIWLKDCTSKDFECLLWLYYNEYVSLSLRDCYIRLLNQTKEILT